MGLAVLIFSEGFDANDDHWQTAADCLDRIKAQGQFRLSALLELKALATKQNPLLVYFDPLQLATANFWSTPDKATIGFLRHAEIKHGRVAMAAFVGYWVQSNWHWPWNMSLDGSPFPAVELGPEAQWDAIPANAKWQILVVIAALEIWGEASGGAPENVCHCISRLEPPIHLESRK